MSVKSLIVVALILTVVFAFKKADHKKAYATPKAVALSPAQQLGKLLFFDPELSNPPGQACAGCHKPDMGFCPPDRPHVSQGVVKGLFGSRNTPTISYAMYIPPLQYDTVEKEYSGGLFWDGRANTLVAQADGPLMNHLEMNNVTHAMIVGKVKNGKFAKQFENIYGKGCFKNVEAAYVNICRALSDYERSTEVSPFTSKYDYYVDGKAELTESEMRGMKLFNDSTKGNCFSCHPTEADEKTGHAMFTDYTYDNIGAPLNKAILSVNQGYKTDMGLGAIVKDHEQNGKFRVPTLRNVALTAPYLHNGVFKTLEEVMNFYNERDLGKFDAPEVAENLNKKELGDLKLTKQEKDDIVAFMKTLTDGYKCSMP